MSSPFEVRRLLSHGSTSVTDIVRTMCHMITDITANHRLSSRTVHVLPVRQFAKYPHPTYNTGLLLQDTCFNITLSYFCTFIFYFNRSSCDKNVVFGKLLAHIYHTNHVCHVFERLSFSRKDVFFHLCGI